MNRVRDNSLLAYWQGKEDFFSSREQMILEALQRHGSCTDRELCAILRFDDLNCVRPRITELVKLGVIWETGDKGCDVTKRRVRVVCIRPDPRRAQRQFEFLEASA